MNKLKFNISNLIYLLTLFLLCMDAYRSRGTVASYLHITSRALEMWALGAFILLRIFRKQTLHPLLNKFNTYLLPITVIVGTLLTFWEYNTYPNRVYAATYIQFTQVIYISVYATVVWLINHTDTWFKMHYQKIIFFVSLWYVALANLVSFFPRDLFARFSKEDNLVENLQFIVLALATYWAGKISRRLYRSSQFVHAAMFAVLAVLLFLATGDEISWGQRIFHVATPATIAAINDQKEITIHNLQYFSGLVGISYILIGLYGAVAWISQYIIPKWKKAPMAYYIPPVWCAIFYFSGFAYNYYALNYIDPFIGIWSESAELMIYAGIMCTLLSLVLQEPKKA